MRVKLVKTPFESALDMLETMSAETKRILLDKINAHICRAKAKGEVPADVTGFQLAVAEMEDDSVWITVRLLRDDVWTGHSITWAPIKAAESDGELPEWLLNAL